MKHDLPLRVLLVEENSNEKECARQLLKNCGMQLTHVADIAAAREYIAATENFDAILLDFSQAHILGQETLREIHACATPPPPVLVLCTPDTEDNALLAVREGAQDYLLKDEIDTKQLQRMLCYLVEQKKLQDQLRREKYFSSAILRNASDGVAVLDSSGCFKYVNPAMRRILYIESKETMSLSDWVEQKILKSEERVSVLDSWNLLVDGGEPFEVTVEIGLTESGRRWSRLYVSAMPENDFILHAQDVTLSIQIQDQISFTSELLTKQNIQLQKMSTTDQLTGVLHRSALYGAAEQQWSRAVRKGEYFSVILMDIDLFKNVNDTHGHLVGDMVLERLGHMLNTVTRPYDQIGRWGGEEFLVVLPGTSCDDALVVAERMRSAVSAMDIYVDDATTLKVTASFGVAGREKSGVTQLETLFTLVEKALLCAKSRGRDRACCYSDGMV